MNRRDVLAALAALPFAGAAQAQTNAVAGGRLVEYEAVASDHLGPRNVTVWLPPGYDASDARYPILYMHDGQNLFDPARAPFGEWGVDEHLGRLIAKGQVRAPIVVGIWNTPLRLREYVPADLIAALESGKVAWYATDVLPKEPPPADLPLLRAPNCIITPHIAWAALETRQRLRELAVDNVRRYLAGTPSNVVS